jgi:geranylgeranyl pyrophosphate synthase
MEGKKTYLTVTAMASADSATSLRLARLLHDRDMLRGDKIAAVLEIYDRLDARLKAEEAVSFYTRRAVRALESLSVPAERIAPIKELAQELTMRKN